MEVPTSVLPALFNVSKLKECNIHCASDPTAWINGFIETFEQAVDELRMVASVTVVLNEGYGDSWGPSSVTHAAPPRLVHPAQTDLLPPQTAFLDKLLADGLYLDDEASRTQTKCELYVVTNAVLKKRLHVYKWRIDETNASPSSPGRTYHHQVTHIVLADL